MRFKAKLVQVRFRVGPLLVLGRFAVASLLLSRWLTAIMQLFRK